MIAAEGVFFVAVATQQRAVLRAMADALETLTAATGEARTKAAKELAEAAEKLANDLAEAAAALLQAQADSYAAAAAAFASTTETPWAKYEAERAAAVAQYYQDTLDDYVDEVAAKAEAARKERIEQAEAAEKANNDTAAADAARLRSDADALLSRTQSAAALANQRAALGMEGRVAPNLPNPPASADSGIAGVDASVFTAATDHAYHAALIGQMFSAGTTTGISLDSYTSHTPIDYALPQHWFWAGWSHLYGPHNWSDAPLSPTPVTAGRLSGNKLRENLLDTYGSAYDAWDGVSNPQGVPAPLASATLGEEPGPAGSISPLGMLLAPIVGGLAGYFGLFSSSYLTSDPTGESAIADEVGTLYLVPSGTVYGYFDPLRVGVRIGAFIITPDGKKFLYSDLEKAVEGEKIKTQEQLDECNGSRKLDRAIRWNPGGPILPIPNRRFPA